MAARDLLTPSLLETIQRGDAILFLGAGASFGAIGPKGEIAPSGEKLRDILCDRFLGGTLKSKHLSQVAELAKNEAGFVKVQEKIRDLFLPLQPADFHKLIPTFRWYSIVTTNYDLVLERAYDQCKDRQQTLAPILHDGDQFSERLRDLSQVTYLKLHGCITQITDDKLPLILASEEYAKYRKNRERLFRHFQDWARERPVIFCGYEIADPNIQQILFDLTDMGMRRPPYGLVKPGIDAISERYWISKRFAVCVMTFEEFLRALNVVIPKATRSLATLFTPGSSSIGPWMKSHVSPSFGLLSYLQNELIHIHKGMPIAGVSPTEFYEGRTRAWGALQQDLDVRRRISDDVILDAFLDKKKTKPGQAYVIKGYAGSGKAVAVRRIAWDITNLFDGLVFFLKEGALLRRDHLAELCDLVGDRLYIAIEDALPHIREIVELLKWCGQTGRQISVIFAARTNEWNVYAGELETKVENDYELRDLTEREIRQLIEKLRAHHALGRLEGKSELECFEHFKLTAERQLLVALHDLGSEKPFEEIIHDEFKNIQPSEARLLYLDVCTLHRLGVGVRAGLISRISGITFEYFQRDFFRPLEHVVETYFDSASRDNMYRSRHPFIAAMVFTKVLLDPGERAGQIIRLLRNMDVDYSSDEMAFKELIRGRVLADLFASKTLAFQIFDAALESGAPVSFVEHQRAVFEMQHPNGILENALAAIERAEAALTRPDRSVAHTRATILRQFALNAPQKLARNKYREEAKGILSKQLQSTRVSHSFHTLGQLIVDELKEKIAELEEGTATLSAEFQERSVADLIRQAEETLQQGFQRFPGDHFLLTLESELGKLLEDKPRSIDALRRAFEASPGRSYVAVRLAAFERVHGSVQKAIDILQRSLAVNSQSKDTHLALAKLLISHGEFASRDEIIYHLKRSFTFGDSNLDAQFWYARHNFLYGDRAVGLSYFRSLEESGTPPEYKKRVKGYVLDESGAKRRYLGSIKTRDETYCFITCPDLRTEVFAHMTTFKDADWAGIGIGSQVSFDLGFVFKGPVAGSVRPN